MQRLKLIEPKWKPGWDKARGSRFAGGEEFRFYPPPGGGMLQGDWCWENIVGETPVDLITFGRMRESEWRHYTTTLED